MGWMRTDFDFGVPYVNFVIRLRSKLGRECYEMLRLYHETNNPEAFAAGLELLIARVRPELQGGQVLGISENHGWNFLQIQFIHPNLPRAKQGTFTEELLEKCFICGGSIIPGNAYCKMVQNGSVVTEEACCSKECADSKEQRIPGLKIEFN